MYNIIDQSKQATMFLLLNGTNSSSTNGVKIDCAKECPCGVPAIPVPDQWLEVMVTGGFKVWHIIFIIIAFVVTIVVVYCCFHRCRIPRTKQEIEADLMRTNLASKFREYLQEFPNEPTTFMEALKKVQELEEKSSEQDDSGARKRKGWLKLKGKEKQEKLDQTNREPEKNGFEKDPEPAGVATEADQKHLTSINDNVPASDANKTINSEKEKTDIVIEPLTAALKPLDLRPMGKESDKIEKKSAKTLDEGVTKAQPLKPVTTTKERKSKSKEAKLVKTKGEKVLDEGDPAEMSVTQIEGAKRNVPVKSGATETVKTSPANKPTKVRRRIDMANLSRSEAAHVSSRGESIEKRKQLYLPVPAHVQRHYHDYEKPQPDSSSPSEHLDKDKQSADIRDRKRAKSAKSKPLTGKTKAKATKDSTVIQIGPATKLDP